jgi:hypothetical protein
MALKEDIGVWLKGIASEEQLVEILMSILNRSSDRVAEVQKVLSMRLEGEDGHVLSSQVRWLDSQMHFIATLRADADALLDKAELFYLIPAGRSVPCTTEEGTLIPATGSRGKPGDDNFNPKYKELTDLDRKPAVAAACVPYRRLRNEFLNMETAIQGRLYRAKDLLEELKARYKVIGMVDRPV